MTKKTIAVLILLCLALLVFASSCTPQKHLHYTGTYTIKERKGNVTEFYEVPGKYLVLSDTLKKNDVIHINVVHFLKYKN